MDSNQQFAAALETAESLINSVSHGKDDGHDVAIRLVVRSHRAATAGRILVEQGFEQDAISVIGVIARCAMEMGFIVSEPRKVADKLSAFSEHRCFFQQMELRAQRDLGLDVPDSEAQDAVDAWNKVKSGYKKKNSWNHAFPSIRERAVETDNARRQVRKRDFDKKKYGDENSSENLYQLYFAQVGDAVYLRGAGAEEMSLAPVPATSGRTLALAALYLNTLTTYVGDFVRQSETS